MATMYAVKESDLTAIADAIRLKRDIVSDIEVEDMALQIGLIEGESHNWSTIGYSGEPEYIKDGYDYAVQIKNNWENVANLEGKFQNDNNLVFMPMVDTSNATYMKNIFYGCSRLSCIPLLDTSNVTYMYAAFRRCSALTTIPLFDTSRVTSMYQMFDSCEALTEVPSLNTENVGDFLGTFTNCPKLTTIPLLDFGKAWRLLNLFTYCSSLTNLGGFKDLGKAYSTTAGAGSNDYTLNLAASNLITHDSLMNVINNLYDIATKGCAVQNVKIGSTNLAKLSANEIAIATAKGWNVIA